MVCSGYFTLDMRFVSSPKKGGQLVRLYRSFNSNPQITDHFYTTERLEQHLMASQGFLMERKSPSSVAQIYIIM
jgi:hypothetical protein